MSIEIYNKAVIVHKSGVFYYLLKHHSKNDCICAGQVIVDDNFNDRYITRNSRAGSWSIKAHGSEADILADKIALTKWNCPTSHVYGEIRFGNKKNIAMYWAKQRHKWIAYESMTDTQKRNIDELISYYEQSTRQCDLANIPEARAMKREHTYCDDELIKMNEHDPIRYAGQDYWNLDNL